MQQLDAAALRRLAGETVQITWLLKMDQMSESLEATLFNLRKSLHGWYHHLNGYEVDPEDEQDNLADQIWQIKTSADIDASVEKLAEQNLKIYGGRYLFWEKERPPLNPYEGSPGPDLLYTSQTKMVLSIAPEEKNKSTVRVATGWEPPQKFIASELAGIDSVKIDDREVWSHWSVDDDVPF